MLKYLIALASICLVASQANALIYEGTVIIPQHSKIQRYKHHTGAAAARSNRHTAGGDVSFEDGESKANGIKAEDTSETTLRPFIFNKFSNGMVLEAELPLAKAKSDATSTDDTDTDTKKIDLVGGWVLPESKWAIGAELSIEKEIVEDSSGGDLDTNTNTIGLSATTPLSEGMYLGVSVTRGNDESKYGNISTKRKNDDASFVGLGWINGDSALPKSAIETVISYSNEGGSKSISSLNQLVFNLNESSQIVGEIILGYNGIADSSDATYGIGGIRYDYQFSDGWYLAPEVEVSYTKYSGDDKSFGTTPAFEGGLRKDAFTVFAKVSTSNEKFDAGTSEIKNTGTTIAAGGQYNF